VAERELIAAYVSGLNACRYCHGVPTATARAFGIGEGTLGALLADVTTAPVAEPMKPILRYVGKLTLTPAKITHEDAEAVLASDAEARVAWLPMGEADRAVTAGRNPDDFPPTRCGDTQPCPSQR
jgi:AhpD family alkylhydroperoxidase